MLAKVPIWERCRSDNIKVLRKAIAKWTLKLGLKVMTKNVSISSEASKSMLASFCYSMKFHVFITATSINQSIITKLDERRKFSEGGSERWEKGSEENWEKIFWHELDQTIKHLIETSSLNGKLSLCSFSSLSFSTISSLFVSSFTGSLSPLFNPFHTKHISLIAANAVCKLIFHVMIYP